MIPLLRGGRGEGRGVGGDARGIMKSGVPREEAGGVSRGFTL